MCDFVGRANLGSGLLLKNPGAVLFVFCRVSSPTLMGLEEDRRCKEVLVRVWPYSLEDMLDMLMSFILLGGGIGVVMDSSISSDRVDTQSDRRAAAEGTGSDNAGGLLMVDLVEGAGGLEEAKSEGWRGADIVFEAGWRWLNLEDGYFDKGTAARCEMWGARRGGPQNRAAVLAIY
jgi:hypothetical protein